MNLKNLYKAILFISYASSELINVWIDADVSCGFPDRDVDDCYAIIQTFRSPNLQVLGLSTVFGNIPLQESCDIAKSLVANFGPAGLQVYPGASAISYEETDASRALSIALEKGPLTVIILGPATNLATVLERKPALAENITKVIAVAGRRENQRFTIGSTNSLGLRDLNFENDPDSFRVILSSAVDLYLAPFEISSKVLITETEIKKISEGNPWSKYLANVSWTWLALWKKVFDVNYFNPFDCLAIAIVTWPDLLSCLEMDAVIKMDTDDGTASEFHGRDPTDKYYLIVRNISDKHESSRRVTYCYDVDNSFISKLIELLS